MVWRNTRNFKAGMLGPEPPGPGMEAPGLDDQQLIETLN